MNEDKATRYHRLKRQASIVSMFWGVLLLGGLTATGWSATLRDAAQCVAGRVAPASWHAAATVLLFVVLLSILNEIAGLPLGFYSAFFLERRYELSKETLGGWFADQAKSFGIGVILAAVAAELVYGFIRLSPDRWWLTAGVTFTLLIVGLTNLAPVVLLPIFYSVKPLDRDALRARLLALAERAGARVLGAYEWGLGEKTKKANAALAGLGGTRRILVSDTMLAEFSDDEIEVVLAHEIAHHVHGDIWKGIAFESALIVAGVLPRVAGAARDGRPRRAARRGRRRRAAAAAARRRGGVAGDGAGGARDVARLRAQRRPVRPRPDPEPARVHLGDAPPRRAEPRRRAPLEDRAVAVLQPSAGPRPHRRRASLQEPAQPIEVACLVGCHPIGPQGGEIGEQSRRTGRAIDDEIPAGGASPAGQVRRRCTVRETQQRRRDSGSLA